MIEVVECMTWNVSICTVNKRVYKKISLIVKIFRYSIFKTINVFMNRAPEQLCNLTSFEKQCQEKLSFFYCNKPII